MYYYGKRRKRKRQYVVIDKYDWRAGCWIMPAKYPTIDNQSIHRTYAVGYGPVVRHLCCNNRCANPLHMLRGTQLENVNDETFRRSICRGNTGELSDYWYFRLWFKHLIINKLDSYYEEDRLFIDALSNANILMSKFKNNRYITVTEDKYGKEETIL